MSEASQELFRSVYRNRNSALHRLSYMRLGKSHAIHAALADAGLTLNGKRIFDFGFGPGNFLLSCPRDCHLFGCEIDEVHVEALESEIRDRGQLSVNLDVTSEFSKDYGKTFGDRTFDVIVMSHVLEHIDDPENVLVAAKEALAPGGAVVVVLPLNEKKPDPKHVHEVTADLARSWFEPSGLEITVCRELGWVNYLIQPCNSAEGRIGRVVAQGLGLGIGLASKVLGPRAWWKVTDCCSGKRGQIVLVGRTPGDEDAGRLAPGAE